MQLNFNCVSPVDRTIVKAKHNIIHKQRIPSTTNGIGDITPMSTPPFLYIDMVHASRRKSHYHDYPSFLHRSGNAFFK